MYDTVVRARPFKLLIGSSPEVKGRTITYIALPSILSLHCRFSSSLVDDQGKIAHLRLFARISTMLAALFHPVRRDHDLERVLNDAHLQCPIDFSRSRQRRRCIYFDEPRLESLVNEDVKAIYFKAMLVVNHYGLHRFKRDVNNVADAFKALVDKFFALGHLEKELQILN